MEKNFLFLIKSDYSLILNFIYGGLYEGFIDFYFLDIYFPFHTNLKGTLFTVDIDSEMDYIGFTIDIDEWLYILKLEYNMRNKGILEIKSGETKGLVMESGYFPLYYYLKLKNENYININVNLILSYWDDYFMKNDLEFKGYILDEDTIKRKINGEYISLDNPIDGMYSYKSRSGLLKINQHKENNNDYILIEIKNKGTPYIGSHLFLELITKENDGDFYFLPANQYIMDTFDITNGTIRDNNKYHICTNMKVNMLPHISISPEYTDIDILFINATNNHTFHCSDFDCAIKFASGFKKYVINDYPDDNIYFEVINPKKRIANYVILSYYNYEDGDIDFYLSNEKNIKYIDTNEEYITLSVTFEPIEMYRFGEKYIPEEILNFYFSISGYLYKKEESSDELLNTSSILNERNFLYEAETTNKQNISYSEKFTLIFKDIPRKNNFIYDLQIKVVFNVNISPLDKEFLIYTTEVNLTDILLKEEGSKLWIILGPILGFIALLIIIFFIVKYIRLKKANVNLKEDLKSIAYSNDIQKNVINKETLSSEKESDYESTFY